MNRHTFLRAACDAGALALAVAGCGQLRHSQRVSTSTSIRRRIPPARSAAGCAREAGEVPVASRGRPPGSAATGQGQGRKGRRAAGRSTHDSRSKGARRL